MGGIPITTSRQAPTTPAGQLNPGIFTQGALAGSVSGATNVGLSHPPQSHISALRSERRGREGGKSVNP